MLGVCGPDLRYIYVLSRWEGSAADSRVLRDAIRRQNNLQIPNGNIIKLNSIYQVQANNFFLIILL